jgi:hypothetical protein
MSINIKTTEEPGTVKTKPSVHYGNLSQDDKICTGIDMGCFVAIAGDGNIHVCRRA